jgi:hypothetical protein
MRTKLGAGALALVVLGGGFAAAQNAPGGAPGSRPDQQQLNLSRSQGQMVSQGLSREAAQSAPNYQGQVGSKPPDSTAAKPLPNNVTEQVPETKTYLFVKLPDRILLIDPDTQLVAEIVPADATTGSGTGSPSGPSGSGPDRGSSPGSGPR